MNDPRSKLISDWAASKVGCGYIMGATGWICTPQRRQQQATKYPKYADTIMGIGAKWDGVQCFDCAQITRFGVQAAGGYLPSGATTQWTGDYWLQKGTIDTVPDMDGVLLYRYRDGRMQHTGVGCADGYAIDARGTADGVIRRTRASFPWTHWGIPILGDNKEDEDVIGTAVVYAAKGSTVNLRSQPDSGAVILERVPVGTTVTLYEQRNGWTRLNSGNNVGWMMDEYLTGGVEQPPEPDDDVLLQARGHVLEAARLLDEAMGVK